LRSQRVNDRHRTEEECTENFHLGNERLRGRKKLPSSLRFQNPILLKNGI